MSDTSLDARARELLDFWFGPHADDAEAARAQAGLWWGHAETTDADVRRRFGDLIGPARAGDLDGWAATPRGRLALVLLLDQVPRNVHRGTPDAFAGDSHALALTRGGLRGGDLEHLRPVERVFLLMPLEHAEDLACQEECVERMQALAEAVPEAWREPFEMFADYAVRHRDVIARFGRFPHRNAILGRPSTPEELEFLSRPGSSF